MAKRQNLQANYGISAPKGSGKPNLKVQTRTYIIKLGSAKMSPTMVGR